MESRIIPVTKRMIERIMVPEAKIARGTCVIYLVLRNSSTTMYPDRREMRSIIPETAEKKKSGLYSLKIMKIVFSTNMPSLNVFNFE